MMAIGNPCRSTGQRRRHCYGDGALPVINMGANTGAVVSLVDQDWWDNLCQNDGRLLYLQGVLEAKGPSCGGVTSTPNLVPFHTGPVASLASSFDGKRLATGSGDMTIKVWDMATGVLQTTIPAHRHEVACLAFSPDGTLLASGSLDDTVKLWDVRSR